MNINDYYVAKDEKPLDRIVRDGGFVSIFRTIGCIGDSLSSGEFESTDESGSQKGYHDMFDYSWGQFMARAAGCKVYNFSRGGMTAKEYMESFADKNDFWNPDKLCRAYILALGVNDLFGRKQPVGDISDINADNYELNADTFCGWYARIIQRLKQMQPKARFFLVTMPRANDEREAIRESHAALLHKLAEYFDYTYVVDLNKYAPVYDENFKKAFYLGGHMNAAGYKLTADMIMSYIDYIIRADFESFSQIGFVGGDVHNYTAKW